MKRNIIKLTTLSMILGSVALSPILIHQNTNDGYAAISPTKEIMYNYPDIITTVEAGSNSSISIVNENGRDKIYVTGTHYAYGKQADAVNITPDWFIDEKIIDVDGSAHNYVLLANDEADGSGQDRVYTYGTDGYGLNMDPENGGTNHFDWVETTPEEWIGKDIKDVQMAQTLGLAVISDGESDEIWAWGALPTASGEGATVTREPIMLFNKDNVGAESITVDLIENNDDGGPSFVSVINWDDKDDTTNDQHVFAFGYNAYYNNVVENVDEQPYYTDLTIDGLDPNGTIEQLDVGHYTTKFIFNDGEYQHVYVKGINSYGNFGDGSSTNTKYYSNPVEIFNTDPSDSELYLPAFAEYSSVDIIDMDESYGPSWIQAECINAETGAKEDVAFAAGINRDGQLGLGNTSNSVVNYTDVGGVITGKEIYDIFSFAHETLIVTIENGNKHVYATGINNTGMFGNGTYNGSDYFKEIHFTGTDFEVVEEESLWLVFTIITILIFLVMIIVMLVLIHYEHKSGKEIEWLNSGKHKN